MYKDLENYQPKNIEYILDEDIKEMCHHWNHLAQKHGYNGMYFIFKNKRWFDWDSNNVRFNYEPHHDGWLNPTMWERRIEKLKKILHIPVGIATYNYDTIWRRIIKNAEDASQNELLGAFVNYDDSPRRSTNGKIVKGSSPEKFKRYLSKLIDISENQGKPFVFITAWNEWGEGAYLEPDTDKKFDYLHAMKELF